MKESDRPGRPNIRQVASVAGVSHMTVSRVLNDYPGIRDVTRQRVLDAIEQLNFRPNSAARALATHRNRRIGVLLEGTSAFGPTSALRCLELAAGKSEYSVTSVTINPEDGATPQWAADQLVAQGVDAICVIAPRSSSVAALRKVVVGLPILVIKSDADPHGLTLSVDQGMGTGLVVDHLVQLGHRDILHVSGPLDWLDARVRERAFQARCKAWHLPERPIVVGDWTAEFAYDFARGLKRRPEYTAIFAANDETALGLIHGFTERAIHVPEELSIVGFDDIPLAAHFLPPLTTVRQDFHEMGARALDMLVAAVEGKETPRQSRVPVELVVRQSTAAPRGIKS